MAPDLRPGSEQRHRGTSVTYEPIVSLLVEIDRKLDAILAALRCTAISEDAREVAMTPQRARAIAHGHAQLAASYAEAGMVEQASSAAQESQRWLVAAEVEAAGGK